MYAACKGLSDLGNGPNQPTATIIGECSASLQHAALVLSVSIEVYILAIEVYTLAIEVYTLAIALCTLAIAVYTLAIAIVAAYTLAIEAYTLVIEVYGNHIFFLSVLIWCT